MTQELSAGALVAGRYRLEQKLGEGGMGTVWAATHTVTRKRHALKFLKAASTQRNDLRRRFLREARAASAVDHPNVVVIHDIFEIDGDTPVMVMDLLAGRTLGAMLRERRQLSLSETARLLLPAVSAVGTAHALGIVHRDLKPDNIFVSPAPGGGSTVRVLDFGIAKLVASDDAIGETLTGIGALLGTPYYMSPEQAFGGEGIDHRTDIWALGVILYEALSGARPVEGDNRGQVLKRLFTSKITPIEMLVPDLPSEITSLVDRMLSRERTERPEDLREVFETLRTHAGVAAPAFGPPSKLRSESDDGELATLATPIGRDEDRVDPTPNTTSTETWVESGGAGRGVEVSGGPRERRSALRIVAAGIVLVLGGIGLWEMRPAGPRASAVGIATSDTGETTPTRPAAAPTPAVTAPGLPATGIGNSGTRALARAEIPGDGMRGKPTGVAPGSPRAPAKRVVAETAKAGGAAAPISSIGVSTAAPASARPAVGPSGKRAGLRSEDGLVDDSPY